MRSTIHDQLIKLTKHQINEFFLCNAQKQKDNQPYLPEEVCKLVLNPTERAYTLLVYVAYGFLQQAEALLDADPTLLLSQYKNFVITPAGFRLVDITPFECALGGNDPEMATMMVPYFLQLADGKKELEAQYKKYAPHIESIFHQTPYDLERLVNIINNSRDVDVIASLQLRKADESLLQATLAQFRKDHCPLRFIKEPCMHFNYQTLIAAYQIYEREYVNGPFRDVAGKLFYTQIISYLLRNLPARDRQVFAAGLYQVAEEEINAPRTFQGRNGNAFPVTNTLYYSHRDLGFTSGLHPDGTFNAINHLNPLCITNKGYPALIKLLLKNKSQFKKLAERIKQAEVPIELMEEENVQPTNAPLLPIESVNPPKAKSGCCIIL